MGSHQNKNLSHQFPDARRNVVQEIFNAPPTPLSTPRRRFACAQRNTQWMLWISHRDLDIGQQSIMSWVLLPQYETGYTMVGEQMREMPKACHPHTSICRTPHCHAIAVSFLPMGDGHTGTVATGQRKFLLFVIDYFTKWANRQVEVANRQIEVTNRILVQGIRKRLNRVGGNWIEELTSVLWSYRTTPRGSTGKSPFTLAYGTEVIIPAELGMPSHRILHFNEENNSQLLKEHIDLIDELRETAFIRA
ncbi:hypothetical protein Sango_1888000 [Sesamum angolense]|uniref:Integrase catalytic domain-containing protein n=1 Tax=Sesamum angolense TaxID=2727404 RepID=A0AAE2BQK3_9LAMI|nr:hypothetical protein Sango_1888000 [Sesamum angolense]